MFVLETWLPASRLSAYYPGLLISAKLSVKYASTKMAENQNILEDPRVSIYCYKVVPNSVVGMIRLSGRDIAHENYLFVLDCNNLWDQKLSSLKKLPPIQKHAVETRRQTKYAYCSSSRICLQYDLLPGSRLLHLSLDMHVSTLELEAAVYLDNDNIFVFRVEFGTQSLL
ncbi:UNVERIFIED_CONTAM: hypothetical protein Sindi_2501600 [Sesamum indicum]